MTIDSPVIFTQEFRVLDSLICKGHVNSKRIEDIVLLDSSPTFDSKMDFSSLEAQSINTDYTISGFNFNELLNSRIYRKSNETQVITGDWSVQQAIFSENSTGNGLINGRSIDQIEKNLRNNVRQVQTFLSNYTDQYQDLCRKLQSQVDDYRHSSVYILKYLELEFKITEERDINSFYDFQTKKEHYLIVNAGCGSKIYLWNKSKQRYRKTAIVETGIIYDYASVEHENGDFFLITNSKVPADAPCKHNGLNSWKLVDNSLVHIMAIKTDGATNKIFSHKTNSQKFYALDSTDKVMSFDAFGVRLEEWKLPTEGLSYSFLPHGILPDLNLYNGKRLFSLESKKRYKRTWFDQYETRRMLRNDTTARKYVINQPDYSMPIIKPMTLQSVSEDNFLTRIKSAGEIIKSSLSKGLPRVSDQKFEMNWPKFARKEVNDTKSTDEVTAKSTSEREDVKKDPFKLMFTIKNPNFPPTKEIGERNENSNFSLKAIGKSIMETIKNPVIQVSTSTVSPGSDEDSPALESPEERYAETAVVQTNGVRDMENSLIPEHGEIVVIEVGPADQCKQLFAVSRKRISTVVNSGDRGNDFIEVNFKKFNDK